MKKVDHILILCVNGVLTDPAEKRITEDVNTSTFPFLIKQTQAKFGKGAIEFLKTL